MIKKDNENFENSTKCWIRDNAYVKGDVKVRDHCQISRKYRGSAHRDCNVNVKLYHCILLVFHNLKRYHSHLIMEELSKFRFKINVIPNGFEKYMSFNKNTLIFINIFQIFKFFIILLS